MFSSVLFFFFFQAEDGIRALTVTGVQTCALPISDISILRVAGDADDLDGPLLGLIGTLVERAADRGLARPRLPGERLADNRDPRRAEAICIVEGAAFDDLHVDGVEILRRDDVPVGFEAAVIAGALGAVDAHAAEAEAAALQRNHARIGD